MTRELKEQILKPLSLLPPPGLQGELVAAQKDDEYVRKKLKLLEDEKIHLRHKYSDDEDEFRRKYGK